MGTDGTQLAVRVAGSAPPVLLLPQYNFSGQTGHSFAHWFDHLVDRCTVICFDMRGADLLECDLPVERIFVGAWLTDIAPTLDFAQAQSVVIVRTSREYVGE